MNVNSKIAFVRTVFSKPHNLYPTTEIGENGKLRICASLQVVRFETDANDFVWQVFGLGWATGDGRALLCGEASPHEFVAGNRLVRHTALSRNRDKIGERIQKLIGANLELVRGGQPTGSCRSVEQMNRPLAWHPVDLVDYRDVRGATNILIPARVPGTEGFVVPQPEGLTGQFEVIENLKKVSVDHTVVDLGNFQNWVAVDVDSLQNKDLGISMIMSLKDSDAVHDRAIAAMERRRKKVEASKRVTAKHASHPASEAAVSEAAAEEAAISAAQDDGGVNPS